MPNILQNLVVIFIFVSCAVLIVLAAHPDTGNSIVQLVILAGIVVAFLDRHASTKQTNAKIDENTALTARTEKQINSKTDELIRAASQAAYAKGLLDGEEKERQRTKEMLNAPPTP